MTKGKGWYGEPIRHSEARMKALNKKINNYINKNKYPLRDNKSDLEKTRIESENKIKDTLTKSEFEKLEKINEDFSKGEDSLSDNSIKGELKKKRKELHRRYIQQRLKQKGIIDKKDPDLYMLGGVPGSGKSFTLVKRYIQKRDKSLVSDNDDTKMILAKKEKPKIKKYPMAHASRYQRESSLINSKLINEAKKRKANIIIDTTISKPKKQIERIKEFKKAGYDTYLYGTQMRPTTSIKSTTKRFLTEKPHRYVPPFVIAKEGNTINKNIMRIRKNVDNHLIVDTDDFSKIKTVSKEGKINREIRSPK